MALSVHRHIDLFAVRVSMLLLVVHAFPVQHIGYNYIIIIIIISTEKGPLLAIGSSIAELVLCFLHLTDSCSLDQVISSPCGIEALQCYVFR